jgi:hypothetical protein
VLRNYDVIASRIDAIRFLRRCAAMKGPFQEQAAKYVESIRSEYSLP